MSIRSVLTGLAVTALLITTAASSSIPASAKPPRLPSAVVPGATPDFDGDGNADLAWGTYVADQFAITIYYGSGRSAEFIGADVGLPFVFGESGPVGPLLAADFNADGYDDLAFHSAGDPDGDVIQVFGSATGLDVSTHRNSDLPTPATMLNAVGDLAYIATPKPRLAIGIRGNSSYVSRVLVYDLDAAGVPTGTPLSMRPGAGGVPAISDASGGKTFGKALAAAGDRLFIGFPGATVGGKASAGALVDVTLTASGVGSANIVTQSTSGVGGLVGANDYFGTSLAAVGGRLLVGTPRDDVESANDTGSAQLFTITSTGLTAVKRFSQYGSVPGKAEAGDNFGQAVTLARVCPGAVSAVIGGPGEDLAGTDGAGAVWVIPLTTTTGCAAQRLYQGGGLSAPARYNQGLGGFVETLRDAGSSTDSLALAGAGSFSEGPSGVIIKWSRDEGEISTVFAGVTGLAGL